MFSDWFRYKSLIENMNDAILIENENREIALVNKSFCDLFAIPVSPELMIGSDCSQSADQVKHLFINPELFVERIGEIFAEKQPVRSELLEMVDGRYLERDFIPIFDEQSFSGLIWVYKDLTLHYELENKLRDSETKLRQEKAKQQKLFAVIGHELRTPIAALKMLLDDMDIKGSSSQGHDVYETTESVLSILDDLRYVIRPEEANQAKIIVAKPFAVIERSLNSLRWLLSEHQLKVHLSCNTLAAQSCKFGSQALYQMVSNLVKNTAIHAHATDLWVDITGEAQDQNRITLTLTVQDNGHGIQGEKRDALFEAFTRGNTDADGTGLGLFITKELASQLGGHIAYFDSKYGGAGFTLRFNAEKDNETDSKIDVASPEQSLEGMQILFAEDQLTIQMLTLKQLEKQGAVVTSVSDGLGALNVFASNDAFTLILTDINMPNMNGYELAAELRNKGYKGKIIGVTAAIVGDETDRLLNIGADAVLSKPINMSELKQKLWQLDNR